MEFKIKIIKFHVYKFPYYITWLFCVLYVKYFGVFKNRIPILCDPINNKILSCVWLRPLPELVDESLDTVTYPASSAQYKFSLSPATEGFKLRVEGEFAPLAGMVETIRLYPVKSG